MQTFPSKIMPPKIHVIAVAFKRFDLLKVFVQSWINQTKDNWILTVIHDGLDDEFISIMKDYKQFCTDRIEYICTDRRFNDYGHSLRDIGLSNVKGDYVLLTNADNYFIPKAIEFINEMFVNNSPNIVIFDMVHSHENPGERELPAYSFFETSFEYRSIDISAAIVQSNLASKVGFKDKTHDGDQSYFEDIRRLKNASAEELTIVKIHRVLLVHN
jgi:glycosyltransferase involved in cell wall biosynthesis